jgi:hypothetical protein
MASNEVLRNWEPIGWTEYGFTADVQREDLERLLTGLRG